ncbi:DUF1844 domain-containing protein [Pirellulales bacterium]|nr:DUF1844 domain-containing protein [Pirellulales bacterium]
MSDEAEKKIIIDEDWKSRVTAEKEAASQTTPTDALPTEEADAQAASAAPPESESEPEPDAAAAAGAMPDFPPASFEILVSALATEAMMGMGQIPHPASGNPEPNLSQARYAIDMLEVLQEKTKGNLENAEEDALRDLLHQLRMAFIAAQSVSE